ncbi:MAG: hypothetical protein J7M08_02875, partial [Planctomycetes bacterium]|nr:hypothetical protein [Planctomycetota bacterium]
MKKRNHTVNSRLCSLVLALGLVSLLANVAGADVGFPNPRNDSAVAPGREFSVELRGSGTYTLQITEYDGVNPPSWLPQAPYVKSTGEAETHEWDSAVFSINPLPNWPYVSIADPRLPGPYAGLRENRVYRWRIYDGSSYYPDATGWTVHVPMCQPTDGSTRVGVYVRFLWNAHPDGLAGAQEKLLLRDMDADEVPDWVVTDTSGNITGINDDLVVKTYDPVNGTDQEKLREFWHFDPNYERLLPGRTYQWRIVYCDGDGNPLYDDASVDDIKDPGEEYFWADLRDDFAAGWEFTTVPEFSSAKLNESGTEALVVYWESMYGTLALDPEEKDYDFKGIAEDLVNIHENIHNPSIQTAMVGSEELTASYGGLNNDAANRADCTPQADWVPEITDFDGWYTMTRAERAATGPNETGGLSAKDDFVYGSQDRYEEWTARAIRTLLQDAAHAWNDPDGFGTNDKADAENLQYVILVGDADRVAPSFYFHYSSVAGGSTVHHWVPTDFFYSSQTKTPDVSTSPAYQVGRIPVGSKHYYRTEDTHGLPYEPDEPCIEKIHNYAALLNSDTNKETAYENWFGRAVVVSGSTEFYRWYQFFSGFAQNLLSDRIQGHDTFSGIKVLQQNIFGTGDEELDWSNVLAHLSQPAEADVPGFVYLLCRGDMWSPTAAGDGDTAWLTPSDPIYDYDFPAIWPGDATDGRRPLLISCTAMLNRFDNALCGNTKQSIGEAATLSPAGPIGVIGFSSSDYSTEVPYTTEYPDLSTHTMNYLKSVDENEGHTMTRLEKGVLKIEREDDPETADIETAVMGKVEFVKLIAEAYQTSTGPGMGDIFNHALGDYIAAHNEDFLAQEPRVASTVFGACLLGDSALLMPMCQRAHKDDPRPELSDMNPRQPVPVTGYRSTPRYNSSDMPVHVIPRYDPDHPEDNDGVDVALHITTDAEVVRVRVLTPFRQNTTYTSGYWYDAEGTLWSDWSFPAPSYADPDMDGDGDPETCATVDSQYLYAFTAYVPSIYLVIVQAQNPVWEPGDGDEWRWLQERWFYVQAVNQFVRDPECNILVVDQDQHDRYYLNGDAWGSQVEDYYVNPGYDGKGYAPGDDPRDHTPPGWGSSGWGWDAHSSLPQPALPVLNKELGEDLGKDAPFKYQYWCSNVYCTLSPNGDTIKNQQRYYGDLTPGAMKSFQDSGGIIVAFSGDLLPDGPYGYLFRYDTTCWEEAQNLQTYLDNGGRYFLTNQYMPDEAALLTVPPVTTDRLVPYIQDFQQDYLGGVTITEDSNYTSMEGLQPNTMSALINDVDIEGANGESNADRTAELDPNGLEAATVFTWYTGAGPGTVGGSKSSAIQNRILPGGGRSLYFTWPFEAIDGAGIVGSGESGRINVMRKIIEWLRNVPK